MKTVIIYAHPKQSGHNWCILKEVESKLKEQKIKYDLLDLYKDKFDPVMHPDQHYTSGGFARDKLQEKYQAIVNDATHLIFIYPVWWNTMPAMMKGFFDKVFVGRLAFRYKKYRVIPFAIPIALWKGKRAAVFVTTGAKGWQSFLVQGNRFKSIVVKDILGFCGIKAKTFTLDGCEDNYDNISRSSQIEQIVTKGIRWLY